jgi:hypothetical protein
MVALRATQIGLTPRKNPSHDANAPQDEPADRLEALLDPKGPSQRCNQGKRTMFCEKCGIQARAGQQYCTACGATLKAESAGSTRPKAPVAEPPNQQLLPPEASTDRSSRPSSGHSWYLTLATVVVFALVAGGATGYYFLSQHAWHPADAVSVTSTSASQVGSSTTINRPSTTAATTADGQQAPVLIDLSSRATLTASTTHPPDTDGPTVYYYPKYLVDGIPETCWSVHNSGSGWVQFDFASPIQISELRLIAGYQKVTESLDLWPLNNRLRRFKVQFADGTSEEHEVLDQRGWQIVKLQARQTTSVRVVILEVYPFQKVGKDGWNDTNISEIHPWGL